MANNQWFTSNGWPTLHLPKDEGLTSVTEEPSVLDVGNCWWGVSSKDGNTNELEIAFRAINRNVRVSVTSCPTSITHVTLNSPEIRGWWSKVKRHAVQHFWGPQESSVPLFLIITAVKSERFVHSNCSLPRTGKEACIRLRGNVNHDTGELRFSTESPWHIDVNELNLTYH